MSGKVASNNNRRARDWDCFFAEANFLPALVVRTFNCFRRRSNYYYSRARQRPYTVTAVLKTGRLSSRPLDSSPVMHPNSLWRPPRDCLVVFQGGASLRVDWADSTLLWLGARTDIMLCYVIMYSRFIVAPRPFTAYVATYHLWEDSTASMPKPAPLYIT